MAYTVGELAKHTGVTIRTLHHYDEIGLCSPSARSSAGYRLYDDDDVLRLQQVLFYRELGFPLDEIAGVLDDPSFDRAQALRDQRQELLTRRTRVDQMIAAVDAVLANLEKGMPMKPEEITQLFGGFDPAAHEEEARSRWGHTSEYQESARRTRRYGKAEWEQIAQQAQENARTLAALMMAGKAPNDPEVQAAAEAHRQHISRWFYPCSHTIHRALAEMYVADARFTASIDKTAPGLARFLRDAILAGPEE